MLIRHPSLAPVRCQFPDPARPPPGNGTHLFIIYFSPTPTDMHAYIIYNNIILYTDGHGGDLRGLIAFPYANHNCVFTSYRWRVVYMYARERRR